MYGIVFGGVMLFDNIKLLPAMSSAVPEAITSTLDGVLHESEHSANLMRNINLEQHPSAS
jgi:hypothetical protein